MPYKIDYLVDGQVIYQQIEGDYSLEDLRQACLLAASHIDKQQRACYVISDLSLMKSFPTNLGLVRIAAQPAATHPNLAKTLSFGLHNPIGNFVFNTMAGVFRIPAKIYPTQTLLLVELAKEAPEIASALQSALNQFNKKFPLSA